MAAEVLPVEAQATHSKPRSAATESAAVMPVSLKERGGVHALVLGEEPVDAGGFGAAGQFVERRVAFAEGGDVFEVVDDGKQVAEAPDAGLVDRHGGRAALLPEPAEGAGVGKEALWAGGIAADVADDHG